MVVMGSNGVPENWRLGEMFYRQRKYSDAIRYYKEALRINTDYAIQGRLADAISQCKETMRTTESETHLQNNDQYGYGGSAPGNVTQPRYEENAVIDLKGLKVSRKMGDMYYRQGQYKAALSEYEYAFMLETDFAEQGKLADIVKRCKEAIRSNVGCTDTGAQDDAALTGIVGL